MAAQQSDFYIGYLPTAPAETARFIRRFVAALALLVLISAVAAGATRASLDSGVFEFGNVTKYHGYLQVEPIPALRIAGEPGGHTWLLLTGFGKFGIPEEMRAHHGEMVEFEGTAIYRRGMTMVEVTRPETFRALGAAPADMIPEPAERLGRVDLTGELVDSKCFLGVMAPSAGKLHRACAIRCLSGGAPAALRVRGRTADDEVVILLAEQNGARPPINLQWAGMPVRVRGSLEKQAGFALLRVESLVPAGSEQPEP